MFGESLHKQEYKVLRNGLDAGLSKQQISNFFNSQGELRASNISLLSQLLKDLVVHVMDRCELTFTMISRIFQIHQHWTLRKRICCCWTIVSSVDRIKLKRTTLEVDIIDAIRYTLHKTYSNYHELQFEKIQTLLSCSQKT